MNTENMKNMVVLKNLPSNIVEEAIVILKPNIKLKKLDAVENSNKNNKKIKEEDPKKYIINEAEMLISNYISKIENDRNKNIKVNKQIEDKCKRLRMMSIGLGIMLLASFLIWLKKVLTTFFYEYILRQDIFIERGAFLWKEH